MKETKQQVRSLSQASKATIEHGADFVFISWTSILETLFDKAMTVFFWIKFGRIGWQEFHIDVRMVGQIPLNFLAGMNASSIPNQNDLAWKVSLEMLECCNDLLAFHGAIKVSFVDFARQGQRHGRRESTAIRSDPSENWSFSFACPSCRQQFLKGETKFIPKDEFCAEPLRLFLALENLAPARPVPILALALQLAAMAFAD